MKQKRSAFFLAVVLCSSSGFFLPASFVMAEEINGHMSCKLDGKDWSDAKSAATQTGRSMLNIASDSGRTEAVSIILTGKLVAGSYKFNHEVSGSYTDASGESYGSTDGSGSVTITKYMPPQGAVSGTVEGSFSGTFAAGPTKKHVLSDCSFLMPAGNL